MGTGIIMTGLLHFSLFNGMVPDPAVVELRVYTSYYAGLGGTSDFTPRIMGSGIT